MKYLKRFFILLGLFLNLQIASAQQVTDPEVFFATGFSTYSEGVKVAESRMFNNASAECSKKDSPAVLVKQHDCYGAVGRFQCSGEFNCDEYPHCAVSATSKDGYVECSTPHYRNEENIRPKARGAVERYCKSLGFTTMSIFDASARRSYYGYHYFARFNCLNFR